MKRRPVERRFGGVLFEVLVSIAIFAAAASFVLSAVRSAIDAQQRSLRQQQAVDLAVSLMAELEIGTLNLTELREGIPRELGSFENFSELIDQRMAGGLPGWGVDVNTERTEFTGLTLVAVTVFEQAPDANALSAPADATVRYTLRQLMPLNDSQAEAYELDEMLENLPTATDDARRQP